MAGLTPNESADIAHLPRVRCAGVTAARRAFPTRCATWSCSLTNLADGSDYPIGRLVGLRADAIPFVEFPMVSALCA